MNKKMIAVMMIAGMAAMNSAWASDGAAAGAGAGCGGAPAVDPAAVRRHILFGEDGDPTEIWPGVPREGFDGHAVCSHPHNELVYVHLGEREMRELGIEKEQVTGCSLFDAKTGKPNGMVVLGVALSWQTAGDGSIRVAVDNTGYTIILTRKGDSSSAKWSLGSRAAIERRKDFIDWGPWYEHGVFQYGGECRDEIKHIEFTGEDLKDTLFEYANSCRSTDFDELRAAWMAKIAAKKEAAKSKK